VKELAARGVDTLVDAAHAPGMVPLELDVVGAAYTTGNFHKWLCAPKGAGFLHVRRDKHGIVRPLSISHGRNSTRTDRSRFRLEHDWTGTFDPAPFLALPDALRFLGGLLPGGIPAWMDHNHAAAVAARRALCDVLQVAPACPDDMLGAMASVALPPPKPGEPMCGLFDPIQDALFRRFAIEIPVFPFPTGSRLLRVSTPAYVTEADIARLVGALRQLLPR
jgi:isopenicillin-N epimerase